MAKVSELDAQVRRCLQLLSNCPYLHLSEDEQKTLLERKKTLLQEKRCAVMVGASETFNPLSLPLSSELLVSYTDLAVIVSR